MPRIPLSAAFCAAAVCQPGKRKTDYWDTITTGFVLEVRSSGGRSYYCRYFDQGSRARQLLIGGFSDISFDQARKAAKRLRSEVVLGGDPLAAKKVKRAVPTYAELAEQHIAHAKTYQKSWWSVAGILTKHLVPKFGRRRIDEITSQEISQFLADKGHEMKPASIAKVRAVMSKSYSLALAWQLPGSERNPVRGVPRPVFDNRCCNYLSAEQAARLLEVASSSPNMRLRSIIELALNTAARISELLHAEWRHIDLERRQWTIPMSKNGRARHVPLSGAAIRVIEQLPRFDGCPYLVPNPETLKPFVSIKHAWQTVRRNAGLRDLRIHDLRHSAASFMINAGVDLYTVGRVLGHADYKSTMRYAHLANDTLLAAVEAGAAKMGSGTKQT